MIKNIKKQQQAGNRSKDPNTTQLHREEEVEREEGE